MDIYTIGGGEIVYEVLKAVALCLNGGGGTLRALLIMGGLSGAFMIYFVLLYGNVEQMMKTWALPMTAMLHLFFIPQTTVWVHDDVGKFHRKLDCVPYGLAVFASNVSSVGKTLTQIVEDNFHTPDDLRYCKTGMIFGSDIMEKAKEFKIVNQNFRENLRNFVGQCVKYDVMLNGKYTFDDLRNSNDVWALATSNPSVNRGIFWLPPEGGRAQYATCAQAVVKFNQAWAKELERVSLDLGGKFFSGRSIGHSSLSGAKLKTTPQLFQLLRREFLGNLQSAYSYLGDLVQSAEEILKQNVLINAIQDAASENSRSSGNPISYAEMKALLQQNYTFETVGRLAAKVLPIMKAIIEALVYACFIFIIPLCMIPNGYRFLFNWAATLVWLQVWAPTYAILNFIMNIAARASTIAQIGTSGGITIANAVGVSEANAEMKALAGYLAVSVPFICIAIVKGVGTFVHLASQMTGASSQSASSSAAELAGGNFSQGNVYAGNRQLENVSQLQRNFNSSLGVGGHVLDTGGAQIRNDAFGRTTSSITYSTGATELSAANDEAVRQESALHDSISKQRTTTESLSQTESLSDSERREMVGSLSGAKAENLVRDRNVGIDEAVQAVNAAKRLRSLYEGKDYGQGTQAGGNVSLGAGGGGTGAGAGISGGVFATNAESLGRREEAATSEDISRDERIVDSFARRMSTSDDRSELTQMSKGHSRTLDKVDQLREEKTRADQEVRTTQESLARARSFTASQKSNLRDEAIEEAMTQNQDMTYQEAARFIDSSKPEDQLARNEVFHRIQSRKGAYPTQSMRQPSLVKSDDSSGSSFRNEFDGRAQETKNDAYTFDDRMESVRRARASTRLARSRRIDSEISKGDEIKEAAQTVLPKQTPPQTAESIKNTSDKISQNLKERSQKGAAKSALNHTVDAVLGVKENDKNV